MFSRRHPYLFFILTFTTIVSCFVLLVSLIFKAGASHSEFILGDKVGVIEITGVILDSKKVINDIKEFREDDTIKAIVLRIDTPGGEVGPSQEIFQEVRKTIQSKDIITSMGSVAASGGYYIAAGTSGIVANPGTITGSIGVLMGYTDLQEVFRKIGLKTVVVKSGEYKDMGSPMREMTERERDVLQDFVDQIHQQFVRDAALGRNMDPEKIALLADGRIFTGEQAKYFGLIDRLGNLEDAIEWAGQRGGIKGKISTVYPKEDDLELMDYLFGSALEQMVEKALKPRITANYLYQPGE